ncbi:MAG: transporter substrate-binding domain-containing protein [Clostridia bacterium]|nr:transporter substrate-binding domain-containing protein [Clostridia bacterium]
MKKFLSILLAILMLTMTFALASCGGDEVVSDSDSESVSDTVADDSVTDDTNAADTESDAAYIEGNGEMIIGITYFEPMNYFDENNELVGFETEFATAVCEKLGVTPKFQEIDWGSKEIELNAKGIDCIWNGMTITEERAANMAISSPYMSNEQVIITKADVAANYATAGSLDGKIVVAEAGSAGEELATTNEYFAGAEFIPVDTMAKAIMEVAAGTADACVVDYITALGMIGEGTDYADLAKVDGVEFAKEEYGIAFRKGSDMVEKVNAAIAELYADGTLADIAEWYNLGTQLIEQ